MDQLRHQSMCEGIVLRLAIFTRFPTPGRAKTRLIPLTGPELAAQVHARLAERTVGVLRAAEPSAALEIHFTGADEASFSDWLGPVHLVEQADGGLTERLLAAMPDPAAAEGTDVEIALAFAETYRMLNNRMGIFAHLKLSGLDRLSLQKHVSDIGNPEQKA
jgi:hypothetical protein